LYFKINPLSTFQLMRPETKTKIHNTFTREPGGGPDTTQWLNENDYIVKNRKFDGKAVDQGKFLSYLYTALKPSSIKVIYLGQ